MGGHPSYDSVDQVPLILREPYPVTGWRWNCWVQLEHRGESEWIRSSAICVRVGGPDGQPVLAPPLLEGVDHSNDVYPDVQV